MGTRTFSSTGLSNVSVTVAIPAGLRDALPAKITSSIAPPRRLFALRSPSTHLIASTTLDLPQPLGPTMPVIGASKRNSVWSAKLLKPLTVNLARRIEFTTSCRGCGNARMHFRESSLRETHSKTHCFHSLPTPRRRLQSAGDSIARYERRCNWFC